MRAATLAFQFLRFAVASIVAGVAIVAVAVYAMFPAERSASLPTAPISAAEEAQTLAALKPPKRARPVIAVVGANEGSETTDYLIPYGVLKRSGVAEVVALAVRPGPITLMPALTIVPDATVADFDRRHPDGADYVIVPAMHDRRNLAALAWIKAQAGKGATIVGICAGALVLAEAGVLRDRRATTHWFWIDTLGSIDPTIAYVRDRRYVADRGVVTTTGVSASLPVSLALVEAIAGRERAQAVAREIGAPDWDAAHASGAFQLTRRDAWTFVSNTLGVWRHETVGIPIADGVDEVTLALVADAYANTYATHVVALARAPVASAHGIRFLPTTVRADVTLAPIAGGPPVAAFDQAFAAIAARYGEASASFARLSLEYPD